MALPSHPIEIDLDPMTLTVGDQKALLGTYNPFRFTALMLGHSNLTEPEIDALLPEEMKVVFQRISDEMAERAVPKASGPRSKPGRGARRKPARPIGAPSSPTPSTSASSPT